MADHCDIFQLMFFLEPPGTVWKWDETILRHIYISCCSWRRSCMLLYHHSYRCCNVLPGACVCYFQLSVTVNVMPREVPSQLFHFVLCANFSSMWPNSPCLHQSNILRFGRRFSLEYYAQYSIQSSSWLHMYKSCVVLLNEAVLALLCSLLMSYRQSSGLTP